MKKFLVSLAVLGSVALAAPDRAQAWVGFSVNAGVPGYGYGYGYPGAVGVVVPPVAVVPPGYGCG